MKKNKTRLKNLEMSSVDVVKRGANQKADIMLRKSADEPELPEGLMKSIMSAVSTWWNGQEDNEMEITKASYMDALDFSLDSIFNDDTMDDVAKAEMAAESIDQFAEALTASIAKSAGLLYEAQFDDYSDEPGYDEETLDGIEKSQYEGSEAGQEATITEEGEVKMKIDKSRFNEAELEQYNALIAKGMVEDDEDDDMDEEFDDDEKVETAKKKKTCKSAELHPEVAKALKEVEEMKKSYEMKEMTDVAKKYATLGKKEDELAGVLYDMKKSAPAAYDNYVALLDEQLEMVNKSGMFEEIGKSGRGYAHGEDKIDVIASEIMKSEPTLSRHEAIVKAYDQNPELLAEYEGGLK